MEPGVHRLNNNVQVIKVTTSKQNRWRRVPGWSRYEVSADGVVRNSTTKNTLSVKLTDSGHMRSMVTDDRGRRRWLRVHHAVLLAFKGPRPTRRHEGLHADGNKANCRAENLRWGTRRANELDKRRVGTAPSTFTGYRPDPEKIETIRRLLAQGESYALVSRLVGYHPHSVSRIARGIRHAELSK